MKEGIPENIHGAESGPVDAAELGVALSEKEPGDLETADMLKRFVDEQEGKLVEEVDLSSDEIETCIVLAETAISMEHFQGGIELLILSAKAAEKIEDQKLQEKAEKLLSKHRPQEQAKPL